MKKMLSVILSAVMLIILALTGCAADLTEVQPNEAAEIVLQIGNPTMTVNGKEKPIDAEGTTPVIVNGRTLLLVRAVIEEMGGTVGWEESTQTVTLTYKEDEIRLVIDETTAYLNGAAHTLDVPPTIINERTMLPIRFIAESFAFEVAWNDTEQKVTLTKHPQPEEPAVTPSDDEENANKMLVVYFSGTGNTKALAEKIAEVSGADIVEIEPAEPYTSADLDYNNDNCRANREQNDENARPAIVGSIENIDEYSTIFLGYPIWWGTMPKIIHTFLDTYDMSGKTIIPFCTSGGSSIARSVAELKEVCTNATVADGFRGTGSTSEAQINDLLDANGLTKIDKETTENDMLNIHVGNKTLTATLADNSSAAALKELLAKGDITIAMHDYGNFEKVGSLGTSLPTNDEQITTEAGDLILYQGNSFVIYYDTNSWNFTRLGKIEDITGEDLKALLGEGDVTVTLSLN